MANTFNLGNGNWAQKTEKLLAYNAENNNYKPLPFDFDRASTATRVNRDGLIETVDIDEPRIDFLNNTKGHLLLEPSRQNLVTYSEDLSEWIAADITVTDNVSTSPDGSQNASKLELNSGTRIKRILLGSMPTSAVTRAYSVFVKADSDFTGAIQLVHSGDLQGFANFDLSDGTVGSTGSKTTANVVNYSNGWYRCTAIFDSSNTFGSSIYLWMQDDDSSSYGGSTSATGSVFAYGFQYEQGDYPTSYIVSNSGSAVTRSAETNYQQNVTQVIGQSEGTMYIEFVPKDTSATQILYQVRSSSGTIGQIDIRLTGGNISTLANDGGSSQFSMGFTSYSAGTKYKVAVRYKLNDSKIYINGSSVGSDTSCSFTGSSLDQISFAESLTSLVPVADILDARLYNTALSDSELQALTS